MTTRDDMCVLTGLEMQLRSSPWGQLDPDEPTQALRRGWENIAKHLKEEHPEAPTPVPFWERTIFMLGTVFYPAEGPARRQGG